MVLCTLCLFYFLVWCLGYEKDVVNSVRKQLEIFTSALITQSDRKPANMNSKMDESETDLTKALEAQLRSFYANLL